MTPQNCSLAERLLFEGQFEDACALFEVEVRRYPESGGHWSNLGICYQNIGKKQEAMDAFKKAIEHQPDFANAWSNLGTCYESFGRIDEAIEAYMTAIKHAPDHADATGNVAISLKERRRFDEAYRMIERAMEIKPRNIIAHSNMIFTREMDERTTPAMAQAERRRWYSKHKLEWRFQSWGSVPDPERKLHVAYLTSDFRRHSAAYCFGPLVFNHDRDAFHVSCYHATHARDDLTERFKLAADSWVENVPAQTEKGEAVEIPIHQCNDNDLVRALYMAKIDILVDLSGHTSGHRLLAMSGKPAPVQVSAVGSITGTGIPQIDYLLADEILVPQDERSLMAETVWDLPCPFFFQAPEYAPEPAPAPFERNGFITFGCLNRYSKISEETCRTWVRLLERNPTARLYMKDRLFSIEENRRCALVRLPGIDPARITLEHETKHREHLAAHANVDVCLDPWPQAGGISTLEALWQGVPVVTLRGKTPGGRPGVTILNALGNLWPVAEDPEQYIEIAELLGRDKAKLTRLRGSLRDRLRMSMLGDAEAYTRSVETAYRAMWRKWCAEQQA